MMAPLFEIPGALKIVLVAQPLLTSHMASE
jgi:hypothetical protein